MRYYYALSDRFAGDLPKEYTYGFANTSTVLAFRTKSERHSWLTDTQLMKARALTRAEALELVDKDGFGCPVFNTGEEYDSKGRRVFGTGAYTQSLNK